MKLALFSVLLLATLAASAQPARLILIRHAEKPADERDAHLSAEGRIRAGAVVKWLSEGKVLGTNGPPVALYAAEPSGRGRGLRCLETLEPTAQHLNLPVRMPHRPDEYTRLAWDLLHDSTLSGKNVVVCWPHEELPLLAAALGVTPPPPKWKDRDFESAYVITFPNGRAKLERAKQKLKKK